MVFRGGKDFLDEENRVGFYQRFDGGGILAVANEDVAFGKDFELVDAKRGSHRVSRFVSFRKVDDEAVGGGVVAFDFAEAPRAVHAVCAVRHSFKLFANPAQFRVVFDEGVNLCVIHFA